MIQRHVLVDVFCELAPIELEGMQLLTRLRPVSGMAQPIDREVLRRATSEIIDYTQRAQQMQSRVFDLNPVPLDGMVIAEFGL